MNDEKKLPALQGYLNLDELKKTILAAFGWSSFGSAAVIAVVLIGESAHRWYVGPYAPIFIMAASHIAGLLRAKYLSEKYLKAGERVEPMDSSRL